MSRIENWKISKNHSGSNCITGFIHDDNRAIDGTFLITSRVKWINFDDKVAQTQNTLYKLGEPLKEDK